MRRARNLPVQHGEDCGGVTEIGEDGCGFARAEFIDRVATSRDADGLGTDDLAAGDVMRSVADYKHSLGSELNGMMRGGATNGVRTKLIPRFAVVGKGAESEMGPEIVMTKFDFRPAPQISREKPLGKIVAGHERTEKFPDAGERSGARIRQFCRQRMQIAVKVARDVFRRVGQCKFRQHAPGDPRIGPTSDFDIFERADNPKLSLQSCYQRALAGAAGKDQGAVDVPEQESFHGCNPSETTDVSFGNKFDPNLPEHPRNISFHNNKTFNPMKTFFSILALICGMAVLTGCSTVETRIAKQPDLFSRLTPEQQQMIREGRVGIGFDMDMVKLALGDPDRVRERTDASGHSEIWYYVNYETYDGALLYRGWYHRGWGGPFYPYYMDFPSRQERSHDKVVFRDGRVTSVEQEKK